MAADGSFLSIKLKKQRELHNMIQKCFLSKVANGQIFEIFSTKIKQNQR